MTSSRFFINSAQPTSLHYHHHRLACTLLWLPQSISTIQSFASFATIPGTLVAPEYILKLSMDPNGLAFLHNGTIFYSPNSNQHVAVPDPVDSGRYQFSENNARLDRFQHPQWWTRPYGFLAFVPLIPRFDGTVFGCLRDITAHICPCEHDGKFSLRPEKAAQWRDLEDLLILVTSLLKKNTHFLFGPSLSPAPLGFVTSVSADIPVLVSAGFQKFKLIPVSIRVLMAGYPSSSGQVPASIFLNYT